MGLNNQKVFYFIQTQWQALGSREKYGKGELKGRPLSLACQIQNLKDHEEMIDVLEGIGLKFGNGKSEKEWTSGDKVKILIKNK